jgi:hypothetical protein
MSKTTKQVPNKGWIVVLSGLGINLTLGILYAYSIFKEAIGASIQATTDISPGILPTSTTPMRSVVWWTPLP